jgi:hypothetical protein
MGKIDSFIVRGALLPTALEDAKPFARSGPHRSVVCLALVALLLVVDVCPAGMPERLRRPCDERLAEDLGTLEAPVPPGCLAPPCRDWGNTGVFLACIG